MAAGHSVRLPRMAPEAKLQADADHALFRAAREAGARPGWSLVFPES